MTVFICDFRGSPSNVSNPEVGWKIAVGYCPACLERDTLFRWVVPWSEWHDLCTHYHCQNCEADYCWPMAWTTERFVWIPVKADGLPVVRLKKAPDTKSIKKLNEWDRKFSRWREDGRDDTGKFTKRPRRPRIKLVEAQEAA